MEKVFESYKGVIIFYILIVMFALLFVSKTNNVNNISRTNTNENEIRVTNLA